MRVLMPTLELKVFGFREIDIINLQKVLNVTITDLLTYQDSKPAGENTNFIA